MMVDLRIRLLVAVAAGLMLFGCNGQRLDSQWTESPITADGQISDWDGLSRYIFDDENVIIGVANDSDSLYLLFRFSNPTLARRISRQGVNIWLNADGKKKETFGLNFRSKFTPPAGMENDRPLPERDSQQGDDRFEMMREMSFDQLTIHDPSKEFPVHVRADGSSGPSAAFDQSDGYTYEFVIPLSTNAPSFAIGTRAGQSICIGFQFGGMGHGERKEMQKDGKGMGGPPSRGGGMGPGGGRGGMGRGGDMDGMGRGPHGGRDSQKKNKKPTEIWIKSALAAAPADSL